ncbi:hypothetical protein I4U23_016595 [Adineta vaga]|nr:hypothetical protein I4U23_016595 [Adineta vaga]
MGGSGCGKISLLETIYGRRQMAEGGSIAFANHQPLSNILTDYVRYVPQVDIMHNDRTVFETVYYSARACRLNESKQILINDVHLVLHKLELHEMCDKLVKTLSEGQRKRVSVAIEAVACPKALLLDEPTFGLDTVACDTLFDLVTLITSSAKGPVTIIIVIHQPSYEFPTKQELGGLGFIVPLSFSRHVQNLLFQHESKFYLEGLETKDHIWGTSVERINKIFEFDTRCSRFLRSFRRLLS